MTNATGSHHKLASRLSDMLVTLHQHHEVCRCTLAEKYGVSERTIFRDLSRLQPLVEHIEGDRYRLSSAFTASLHAGDLTKFMQLTGAAPLFAGQKVQQLMDWAKQETPPPFLVKNSYIEQDLSKSLQRVFAPLQKAISARRICHFIYKDKPRRVSPYRLVNIKHVWYLAAVETGLLKAYRLNSIQWLTLQNETFIADEAVIKAVEQEDDAWFSLEKFEVQLRVSGTGARWFLDRQLLPNQQLLCEEADGSIDLSCKVADTRQILAIVRYWLPHVTILSPDWLHQRLIDELEQSLISMKTAQQHNRENV